ncbi:MAG: hypothetical protein H0U55_07415, partial [Rubrobacteraceae bacterium]|nr:hypothetical protein [Rubrobacteraceae bacterium]
SGTREDRPDAREDRPCEHDHGHALGFGNGLSPIVERNTIGSFAFLIP